MNYEQQLAHDALHRLVTRTCYGENQIPPEVLAEFVEGL